MTTSPNPSPVRPMAADDYAAGTPVRQAGAVPAHPNRDIAVGAVIGAVALYAVPKLLDYAARLFMGGGDDVEYLDIDE